MPRYKCVKCGTESPHQKPCFVCGSKKVETKGPDFRTTKRDKKKKKIERHLRS